MLVQLLHSPILGHTINVFFWIYCLPGCYEWRMGMALQPYALIIAIISISYTRYLCTLPQRKTRELLQFMLSCIPQRNGSFSVRCTTLYLLCGLFLPPRSCGNKSTFLVLFIHNNPYNPFYDMVFCRAFRFIWGTQSTELSNEETKSGWYSKTSYLVKQWRWITHQ